MKLPIVRWTLASVLMLAASGCGDTADDAPPVEPPGEADTGAQDTGAQDAGAEDDGSDAAPSDVGGADTQTPDAVEPPPELPPAVAVSLPEPTLRRLTTHQYRNALRDLFGSGVALAGAIEPDLVVNGLASVGASAASISGRGVEQYAAASYSLAQQALADPTARSRWFGCLDEAGADLGCARSALAALGLHAWRRPLTDTELDRIIEIVDAASDALGGLEAGLPYGVSALLQSPHFLYRAELRRDATGDASPLDGWALASRLAFFLWNTIPDEELLRAAGEGELADEDNLLAQIDRMLDDPRFADGVRAFFLDLYHLDRLDRLSKDSTIFPHMAPDVGPSAREETLRFVEHVVLDRDGSIDELVTLPVTFVNRRLAAIYDVRAPSADGFGQVTFTEADGRRGLLGQLSLLALHSHPISTSPTLRGRFIREVLLCGEIDPPPADLNTALPEPTEDAVTLRDRLQQHLDQSTSCGGCHIAMDPLGLALENFDSLGRWRALDNGSEIDPSGDLDGVPFNDAWHIADVIAEHPDYSRCFVTHLYRYTFGRRNALGDRDQLTTLQGWFEESGGRMRPLMRAIATSNAFRSSGPILSNP